MVAFPLLAAGVSGLFAAALFAQFRRRRRLAQLAWGIALVQYAIASLAVAVGIGGGWDPPLYRVFWLFGALLNVPWLALGSIALLGKRGLSLAALVLVLAGTVWGVVAVGGASVEGEALQTEQIPAGKDVFCPGPDPQGLATPCDEVRGLARAYSLPSFAIVAGIALLSGLRRGAARPPIQRIRANWIIAAGVTLNAVGGFALVSKGRGGPFSVVLAASVTTMFVGFVMASRHAAAARRPASLRAA